MEDKKVTITKRINVIKGLSILMVVASHLAPNISRGGVRVISAICNYYGGILGRIGVLAFLIISGLLYANNEDRDYSCINVKSFVLGKIKRIYGLYFLALLLCTTIYVIWDKDINHIQLLETFIIHAGLLQSFVPTKSYMFAYQLNEPMWYLSMMIFIWVMLKPTATFFKGVKKNGYLLICIATFIIQGIWITFSNAIINNPELLKWMTYVNPIYCFSIFLLGYSITMYLKDYYSQYVGKSKIILRLNLLLVLVLLLVLPAVPLSYRLYVMEIPVAVLINNLCFMSFFPENRATRILGSIGERSTTIFIVHFVPILLFRKLVSIPYLVSIILCIFMIITLTEAYEIQKKIVKKRGCGNA